MIALSARHVEVLRLVADGLTNQRIAAELGINPETVKTHLRDINSRLGTSRRVEAVAVAMRAGLLT